MKKILAICAAAAVMVGCNETKYEFEASFASKYEGKTAVLAGYDDSLAITKWDETINKLNDIQTEFYTYKKNTIEGSSNS